MKTYDFIKTVTVIYMNDEDKTDTVVIGIDMVEYGGGDWDEPIVYCPETDVISSTCDNNDIVNEVCKLVSNCDMQELCEEFEYEVWSEA